MNNVSDEYGSQPTQDTGYSHGSPPVQQDLIAEASPKYGNKSMKMICPHCLVQIQTKLKTVHNRGCKFDIIASSICCDGVATFASQLSLIFHFRVAFILLVDLHHLFRVCKK